MEIERDDEDLRRAVEIFERGEPIGPMVSAGGTPMSEELAERLADEAEAGYDLSKARRVRQPSPPDQSGSTRRPR